LASFIANVYLARVLGPHEFGRYSLAIAILTFSSFFMDFGYFASGARLMAGTHNGELRRGYVGALIVIGAITSMLFVGVVIAVGLIVDRILPDQLGGVLLAVAVATPAMVAPFILDQTLKASGRVHLLGAWQAVPRGLFLIAIGVAGAVGQLSALTALALFLLTGLVAAALVGSVVRPSVKALRARLREIAEEQRHFGKELYVGKLANLASYNTDKLLLGFFRDAQAVGHYSLAMSFGNLVTMFGQSVAAAGFMEFAHRRPISAHLLRWNSVGILITSLAVLAGGELVVLAYLGPAYSPVALLLVLSVIACACQAAYQPYNSWLLANGSGLDLKRFLFVVAGINIAANVTLIPAMGATGAAVASGIGMMAYLVLAVRMYRQKVLPRGVS